MPAYGELIPWIDPWTHRNATICSISCRDGVPGHNGSGLSFRGREDQRAIRWTVQDLRNSRIDCYWTKSFCLLVVIRGNDVTCIDNYFLQTVLETSDVCVGFNKICISIVIILVSWSDLSIMHHLKIGWHLNISWFLLKCRAAYILYFVMKHLNRFHRFLNI